MPTQEVLVVPSTASHVTIQKLLTIFFFHSQASRGVGLRQYYQLYEFRVQEILGSQSHYRCPTPSCYKWTCGKSSTDFQGRMKKFSKGDIETTHARFLFHYCNTPHSTTEVSSAEPKISSQHYETEHLITHSV